MTKHFKISGDGLIETDEPADFSVRDVQHISPSSDEIVPMVECVCRKGNAMGCKGTIGYICESDKADWCMGKLRENCET